MTKNNFVAEVTFKEGFLQILTKYLKPNKN